MVQYHLVKAFLSQWLCILFMALFVSFHGLFLYDGRAMSFLCKLLNLMCLRTEFISGLLKSILKVSLVVIIHSFTSSLNREDNGIASPELIIDIVFNLESVQHRCSSIFLSFKMSVMIAALPSWWRYLIIGDSLFKSC